MSSLQSALRQYGGIGRADRDLSLYMGNFQNILSPGHVPCMTKEYKPQVAQQLEAYMTPDELKKYVLKSPRLKTLIDYYVSKTGQRRKDVERQARELLDEIGLARSLPVIRWLGMCITAVAKRICTGIYVNEANLSKVKARLGRYPTLYLPSHRSYCDFILMSYICFHYDIEIPGIAAGMDFHAMVGMGNMLRKTGAFFMRRSFSGDDLYWDVFREYVSAQVTNYHIGIEFFIEGTRSRNFKALVPKIGLLSMALQPLFLGEVPDILVVPIGVSYERLLEEQLFVFELLGVPKPKESTKGFFKALKIIEQKFGRMYLDFGEPISVRDYLGDMLDRSSYANVGPHLQKLQKHELSLVKNLAFEIVYQQQCRIVITTFNLVATYFAFRTFLGQCTNLEQLSNGVLFLKTIFERFGALLATEEKSIKMDIIETLEIHSNVLLIPPGTSRIELVRPVIQMQSIDIARMKAHKLGQESMEIAVPALSLQLYVNPCMFWLATPSLMVLSAMKLSKEAGTAFGIQKDQLRIAVDELCSYFSHEFVLVPERRDEEFRTNLQHLTHFKVFDISDRIRFHRNEVSEILLSSIAPFLCGFIQVVETILLLFKTIDFTEKDLLIASQKRIETLLLSRSPFTHPLCLSLECISTNLTSLVQNHFVTKQIGSENSIVTYYSCHWNEMTRLRNDLLQYCNLLPFLFHDNSNMISKL